MTPQLIPVTAKIITELADSLMFNITEQQLPALIAEFKNVNNLLTTMINTNTEHIVPTHYPFPIIKKTLRSDSAAEPLPPKSILKLAPASEKNYIVIKQVIKNET